MYPHGIDLDSAGNVYVGDYLNHRIVKFTSDGNFINQWGSGGTGNGQLSTTKGVFVDSVGNVYVADYWNLGAGINIGWGDGASLGGYGEVGYRVGGTGFGSGVTASQSLDYNFKHSGWSTTTAEGAYASLGPFNAGINFSQTYDMSSKQWSNGWGVSAGVGIGNDASGIRITSYNVCYTKLLRLPLGFNLG